MAQRLTTTGWMFYIIPFLFPLIVLLTCVQLAKAEHCKYIFTVKPVYDIFLSVAREDEGSSSPLSPSFRKGGLNEEGLNSSPFLDANSTHADYSAGFTCVFCLISFHNSPIMSSNELASFSEYVISLAGFIGILIYLHIWRVIRFGDFFTNNDTLWCFL